MGRVWEPCRCGHSYSDHPEPPHYITRIVFACAFCDCKSYVRAKSDRGGSGGPAEPPEEAT